MASPQIVLDIIQAVEATRRIKVETPKAVTYFSKNDEWVFYSEEDNDVCDDCLQDDLQTFRGDELRTKFEYLKIVDVDWIMPMVHPNCRCRLQRVLYMGDIGQEIP